MRGALERGEFFLVLFKDSLLQVIQLNVAFLTKL